MAVAFRGQKMGCGSAIFGRLVNILHKPNPGFDPDRLLSALQTRSAEQWGSCVVGMRGRDLRATTIQKAVMEAHRGLAVGTAAFR